jgi:hypothetical protein
MTIRNLRRRRLGQAIVEFALAATLIFFLLAAAVDLGLIFFTLQGLHNAAQEGAAYGSRWLLMGADSSGRQIRVLDQDGIRERVRKESGAKGGIGFVNLLDLNNDGTPDVGPNSNAVVGAPGTTYQMLPAGGRVIDNYIQIQMLWDANADGDPMDDLVNGQPQICADPSKQSPCFVRVTVMLNYQTVFPLTPSFARTTTLRSSYVVRLRDSFNQSGQTNATPVLATVTPPPPTPTPVPLVVSVQRYSKPTGNNPISIKVLVTRGGQNVSGAYVTATLDPTGTPFTVTLTDGGNGSYYACGVGSYTTAPVVSVMALAGASSGSTTTSSTTGGGPCP